MAKKKQSFIASQIGRWVFGIIVLIAGLQLHNVYSATLAQWQTIAAANQLEDSMASWIIHQQMSYGELIPNIILVATLAIVILIILPTIKHAINLGK